MGNLSGPATRAHLEMIQGVVNRLSHNSFLLKGWSVVLVSAMFALSARDSAALFVYLAYFPAIAFWGWTGLRQEQLFRELYDKVRKLPDSSVDYSMDTSEVSSEEVAPWICTVFSSTILGFHGVLVASITLVAFVAF